MHLSRGPYPRHAHQIADHDIGSNLGPARWFVPRFHRPVPTVRLTLVTWALCSSFVDSVRDSHPSFRGERMSIGQAPAPEIITASSSTAPQLTPAQQMALIQLQQRVKSGANWF